MPRVNRWSQVAVLTPHEWGHPVARADVTEPTLLALSRPRRWARGRSRVPGGGRVPWSDG